MTQKSFAEAMRALVLYTASVAGPGDGRRAKGERRDKLAEAVNDLLLPIVKGYGSERSWVLLGTESLQTFGGSGFLQEYPIEQYVRDAKIDTLYEGTTAIQGQDFFFRKIVKDQGTGAGPPGRRDRGLRRVRGRQRPAEGRARAARDGPRGRQRHRRPHDQRPDVGRRLRRGRRPAQHLQGGPQHHPPADGARRRRLRVAAAAPGRGRDEKLAGDPGKAPGVLRGQGRRGAVLRRRPTCPGSPPSAPSPRPPTSR